MSLSDLRIRNLKPKEKPYKKVDFDGLYILINPTGSKLWRFKYRFHDKEKLISMGAYPAITLQEARKIFQDAREVRTKNSKTFYTWFYPVEEMYLACFTDWVNMLRKDMLFGPSDALFPKPKIEVVVGKGFQATGLTREIYANATAFRQIIKAAFVDAGLQPFAISATRLS